MSQIGLSSTASTLRGEYFKTKIGQDYYDEISDAKDRDAYYAPIADSFQKSSPSDLFSKLSKLISQTQHALGELPGDVLFSEVDRRPDGALYYLYSGQGPKSEEQAKERNTRDLQNYNVEHVVPKSWFDAQNPMRDDLHHLFTEERKCNSDRGNLPFGDVAAGAEQLPQCGLVGESHGRAFEPYAGKGEAARAVLYFVTCHPGVVGDAPDEMTKADLPKLLEWHKKYPVTDYERHRNDVIQDKQGNRNPFIDFPELAEKVDFSKGFGS